jgi:putative tryptophan/tyrosine transport system substrate-binding protein
MPVVGFVNVACAKSFVHPLSAFLKRLGEIGYADGQNVVIEYRWTEGGNDRLPSCAADLIQRKVNVIAATSTPAAIVAKAATTTIVLSRADVVIE